MGFNIYLHFLFALTNAITFPSPTGPYNVGMRPYVLNHTTLNDPVAPSGTGSSILVNFYYPTKDAAPLQPYLPKALTTYYEEYYSVPVGTFTNITAPIAPNAASLSANHSTRLPTLLFGPPAAGPPSHLFFALISDLASHGYTVVTVDHPYEPPILVYPNNTVIVGLPPDGGDVDLGDLYAYRLADTSALLDALPEISRTLEVPTNLSHLVFLGHSIGGSAALNQVLVEKARNPPHGSKKFFLGAINIDGMLFGDVAANSTSADLRTPSLLLANSENTPDVPTGWSLFESLQTSWSKTVRVVGGVNHTDFSDLVVWKQGAGITGGNGVIKADRMVQITRKFVGDFMSFVQRKGEGVLSGSGKVLEEWPEVRFDYNGTGNA
ncbi:hypothetical protein K505DRAFT_322101 [Melanomma pulvis-pyrius CBS 109.77]|uniref:1-alkyl-2-acetylglycerophosphocholine esterase n=1 Tax=Melanomma pulvis-pyrius CBS 109.77 TaxID=1314802 RepID=A0A6A6XNY8_9PLEO|nr:hypothetical protein K505DRAFT_322101 [Melanomma pulvis-pyrius CBS 109.77]